MGFFDAYQTEPEITFTFGQSSLKLKVAKVGGGTLFKEYKGPWIMELSDRSGTVIYETDKFEGFNLSHYVAAKVFAWHTVDEFELPRAICVDLEEFADGNQNFETL